MHQCRRSQIAKVLWGPGGEWVLSSGRGCRVPVNGPRPGRYEEVPGAAAPDRPPRGAGHEACPGCRSDRRRRRRRPDRRGPRVSAGDGSSQEHPHQRHGGDEVRQRGADAAVDPGPEPHQPQRDVPEVHGQGGGPVRRGGLLRPPCRPQARTHSGCHGERPRAGLRGRHRARPGRPGGPCGRRLPGRGDRLLPRRATAGPVPVAGDRRRQPQARPCSP
jgi:hypothetical protein